MLQATERLCLLFGSRIHVQNSFAGLKTDNLELRPLQARDAAQLFLFRVHRHLYWKDIWKNKEEWMSKAKNWYGDAVYSKVADRSQLETGEVPIALQRENREEVLDALAAMPLLSEFCQGIPLRIQQTAERVTATLPCLWDLHAQLRSERDRGRAEIQQRLLAKKATMRPGARQIGSAWQLGKVIGQGAHGVVYHALDSASGESFAVKVVEESKELHQELEMLQLVYHCTAQPLEWNLNSERKDDMGYMKLIVDKEEKEKVVGVHILGPNAGEIIQGLSVAIRCGVTKEHFDDCVGIHPTYAESYTTMTEEKTEGSALPTKGGC
ncbi:SEP1 [Symbiodinium sp. KB8]|nr:SEP1 [Symbiodinium sp. KB8]